jgi:hypothetical protein
MAAHKHGRQALEHERQRNRRRRRPHTITINIKTYRTKEQ